MGFIRIPARTARSLTAAALLTRGGFHQTRHCHLIEETIIMIVPASGRCNSPISPRARHLLDASTDTSLTVMSSRSIARSDQRNPGFEPDLSSYRHPILVVDAHPPRRNSRFGRSSCRTKDDSARCALSACPISSASLCRNSPIQRGARQVPLCLGCIRNRQRARIGSRWTPSANRTAHTGKLSELQET